VKTVTTNNADEASGTNGPAEPSSAPRLELRGLIKRYPGTVAVSFAADQRLRFRAGEIHAIVGENGAGKSTIGALVAGLQRPTAGTMLLDGQPYAPNDIKDAQRLGVSIVPQESLLVANMTVAENLVLARPADYAPGGIVRSGRRASLAREALDAVGAEITERRLAGELSREDQKFVELARALQRSPRVLVVDEMTEALSRPRIEQLFKQLRSFAAAGGLVLYVSHLLDEIFELCGRATIMKDGTPVTTLETQTTNEDQLAELMVGRVVTQLHSADRPARARGGRAVVSVSGLCDGETFRDVSFDVYEGEIVGIGGLVGCGKEAVVRALSGHRPSATGTTAVDGVTVALRTPATAIDAGIAYVPGERDRDGIILGATIRNNVVLASQGRLARYGITRPRLEMRTVEGLIERLKIKCNGPNDRPTNLSGGNRQKVVLAKWLLADHRLQILENPTHGIDVGAKSELYTFARELADSGGAILLVTDELPELLHLADRILVMRGGVVTFESEPGTEVSEEQLIKHML
jgi:ABC-type sugar transport system ATPase subunit